jgi:hypothetical protein
VNNVLVKLAFTPFSRDTSRCARAFHRLSTPDVLLQRWRPLLKRESLDIYAVAWWYITAADRAKSRPIVGLLDFALQVPIAGWPDSTHDKSNIIPADCFNQLCRVAGLMSGNPGAQVRGIAAIVASVAGELALKMQQVNAHDVLTFSVNRHMLK